MKLLILTALFFGISCGELPPEEEKITEIIYVEMEPEEEERPEVFAYMCEDQCDPKKHLLMTGDTYRYFETDEYTIKIALVNAFKFEL